MKRAKRNFNDDGVLAYSKEHVTQRLKFGLFRIQKKIDKVRTDTRFELKNDKVQAFFIYGFVP